jgi:hypothetical protein
MRYSSRSFDLSRIDYCLWLSSACLETTATVMQHSAQVSTQSEPFGRVARDTLHPLVLNNNMEDESEC